MFFAFEKYTNLFQNGQRKNANSLNLLSYVIKIRKKKEFGYKKGPFLKGLRVNFPFPG